MSSSDPKTKPLTLFYPWGEATCIALRDDSHWHNLNLYFTQYSGEVVDACWRPWVMTKHPGRIRSPFSNWVCGSGRSWVYNRLLPCDTPHMCMSRYLIICQKVWDKLISTFAWLSLLWRGKTKVCLAGLCTPSKTVSLLPWGPAKEDHTGHAVPALLHSSLPWFTHRGFAEECEAQEKCCTLSSKILPGQALAYWNRPYRQSRPGQR